MSMRNLVPLGNSFFTEYNDNKTKGDFAYENLSDFVYDGGRTGESGVQEIQKLESGIPLRRTTFS